MASKKTSIGADGVNMGFQEAAALGLINGVSNIKKFGTVLFGSTGEEYTVWAAAENGFEIKPYPTAAISVDVSSESANDTLAGTGARKVTIYGLDANYVDVSETVELAGQTRVSTTQTFLRIFRANVTEVGSGGMNEGNIWVYDDTETSVISGVPQTDALKEGLILAGAGQTQKAFYTVPAGYVYLLHDAEGILTTSKANASIRITMQMRLYNENSTNNYESWRDVALGGLDANGSSMATLKSDVLQYFPEKTDIRILAESSVTAVELNVRFEGNLISMDYL